MKQVSTFIFSFLFAAISSYSQVDYPGSLDDKNTPLVKSKGEIGNNDLSVLAIKSCIKFEPTLLFRGIFAFAYEWQLVHNLTLQGTAGIAFDKDFIQVGNVVPIETNTRPENEVALEDILTNGRGGKTGYYVSGDAKIYFSNDIFNDGYVGFRISNSMYSLNYRAGSYFNYNYPVKPSAYIINDINTRIFNTSFSIIGGAQFATRGTIKTTHDFFIGLGLNVISYKRFMIDKVANRTNVVEGAKALGKTVYFSFGYAIGIGL
ncbi:MAG: hypothetical protein V4635_07095 [Bacteroidota bacterium]